MRILHIVENLRGGGANRAIFQLAKISHRMYGHEHVAMSVQYDDLASLPRGLAMAHAAGLRTVVAPEKPRFHEVTKGADVVLIHWWGSHWLTGLRYRNMVPCRLGIVYHVAGDNAGDLNENVITQVELDWPDVNIAVSQYTYDRVFRDLPEERKAWVIACATPNLERFTRGQEPIPHEGFRVGLTCSLAFNKLRRNWAQMCAEVARNIPATFSVCGVGRNMKTIKNEIVELGISDSVEFHGLLEGDAYGDVIRAWDIMAYPTIRDATPAGLQETMWFGVPPVVFAHTAPAYMVENLMTGLVVRDEQDYVMAIKDLYCNSDLRMHLSRNARAYAEEHFDPVKNAPDFEALLQRLVALPKRRHFSQAQLDKEKIARGTK